MAEIKFTEVTCVRPNVVVEIKNKSKHNNPAYATAGAAGMDLKADINEPQVIEARGSIVIPTGIYIKLPEGYEAQIRSRSGLAFKYDIQAHVGTIDADYTGEIKVKLFNHSDNKFVVQPGERIAQMVVNQIERVEWKDVNELTKTERGEGGFGSTGRI